MTAKRYEEVNRFNGELLRITCPKCGYPMRVLTKDNDNIYQCYCASCKMDRFMKDTLDVQILTVKQLKRDLNRGKGIDGEQLFDLIYNLHEENEHIKQTIKDMMENERTELGRSVLKQLWEAIQ